jgi:hypothetical protein
MRIVLVCVCAIAGIVSASVAGAATRVVNITKARAEAGAGAIPADVEVLVRGLSPAGQSVVNTIYFTPGQGALRVNTSWLVGEADAGFRLIGLNIDLLDAAGSIIDSDDFAGVLAGTALSTLTATGLVPATRYRLRLTAISVGRGSYSMTIRSPAPAPAP